MRGASKQPPTIWGSQPLYYYLSEGVPLPLLRVPFTMQRVQHAVYVINWVSELLAYISECVSQPMLCGCTKHGGKKVKKLPGFGQFVAPT